MMFSKVPVSSKDFPGKRNDRWFSGAAHCRRLVVRWPSPVKQKGMPSGRTTDEISENEKEKEDADDEIVEEELFDPADCSWSFLKQSRMQVLNSGEREESCLQEREMHFSNENGSSEEGEDDCWVRLDWLPPSQVIFVRTVLLGEASLERLSVGLYISPRREAIASQGRLAGRRNASDKVDCRFAARLKLVQRISCPVCWQRLLLCERSKTHPPGGGSVMEI